MAAREGEWTVLPLTGSGLMDAADGARRLSNYLQRSFGSSLGPHAEVDMFSGRVRFNHVAGQLPLAGVTWLVRPKFMEAVHWPARLSSWAAVGYAVRPRSVAVLPGPVSAGSLPTGLADLLARHWSRLMSAALDDSPLISFQRVSQKVGAVRGRVLLGKTLTLPPHQRHRLYCEYSQLQSSLPALRLLSWAAGHLRSTSLLPSTREALSLVAERLPAPGGEAPAVTLTELRLPPGSDAYLEPLRIAVALAVGASPRTAQQDRHHWATASLAVHTYDAFEGLVSLGYREAAQRLGLDHKPQMPITIARRVAAPAWRPAYQATDDSRRAIADDVLILKQPGGTLRFITSETKYKVGAEADSGRPTREDIYQAVTACLALNGEAALLVQPLPERVPRGRVGLELFRLLANDTALAHDMNVGVLRLDLRYGEQGPLAAVADQLQRGLSALM